MAKAPKRKRRKAAKAKRGIWTPALVETLCGLWPSGLSCAEIAGKIGNGFTREACTSKAWKLGLGPHPAGRGAKKRPGVSSTVSPHAAKASPHAIPSPHGEAAGESVTSQRSAKPSPHTASPHGNGEASPHQKKGAVARNLRWRAKNIDRHRVDHAAYMRRWRAGKSASQSAGVTA